MQFPKIKLLKFFVPKRMNLDDINVANAALGAQGKPKFAVGTPAPYIAPFRMLCGHPIAIDITNSIIDKLPEITYSMAINGFAPPAEDIRLRLQDVDGQIFRLMFPTANNTEFAYDIHHVIRNRWLALGGNENDLLALYSLIEIGLLSEYYAVEIYEDATQTLPTWRGLCDVANDFKIDPSGDVEISANYFPVAWAQQVKCQMWYDPAFDGSNNPEHAKAYVQSVFTDFLILKDEDQWANVYKLHGITGYEKVFELHKLARDEGTIHRSGVIYATVSLNYAQSLIFDAMRNEHGYDIWIYKNGYSHKPIIHSITVLGEGNVAVEYDTTGRVLKTEYRKKYRIWFSFRRLNSGSDCFPFNLKSTPAFDSEIEVQNGARLVINEDLGLYHNSDGEKFYLFIMPHVDDVVRYCVERLRAFSPCPNFISGFDFSLPDDDLGVVKRDFPVFTNYCSQVAVYDILLNLAKFTGARFFFEEEFIRDYRQVLYFVNRRSNSVEHLIHRDYISMVGINLTLQQNADGVANLACDFGQDGELSENKNDIYDSNTEKGAMNYFYKTLLGKTKKIIKFVIPNDGSCKNIKLYDKILILNDLRAFMGIDGYSIIGRKTKRNRDGGLTVVKKTIAPSENGAQYGTIEITAERWA